MLPEDGPSYIQRLQMRKLRHEENAMDLDVGNLCGTGDADSEVSAKERAKKIKHFARLADCVEMKNGTVVNLTVTGLLDGENRSTVIKLTVERKIGEELVVLDKSMQANCSDVYPGDVVHVNATIAHSNESNRECDSMVLILHNGPWVNHVSVLVNGNKANSCVSGELRRKVIEGSSADFIHTRNHVQIGKQSARK
ncbi:hypothetical protein FBUS_09573 [Fasciolopsis buskii]|uniref:Uncharacterized protein n=1 Tax=Fasciolopsis buskii TaxID=27845 RepID=A0A8E0S0K2_9TREM|nr:hypothetical protein FBUS_09573 [Fasciolopsis buski]